MRTERIVVAGRAVAVGPAGVAAASERDVETECVVAEAVEGVVALFGAR